MGDSNRTAGPGSANKTGGPGQPYEKPAVSWEEPLEARPGLVVACNKVNIGDPGCDTALAS